MFVIIKRIVVFGCRDYKNYKEASQYIDFCISNIKTEYKLVFVSGHCRGADIIGERYAQERGYEVELYPAEWKKYGNCAGPIRNEKMSVIGDYFIGFWDSKSTGTKSTIKYVLQNHKPLKIKIINT